MLPIAIRVVKSDYVKLAVMRLCHFFNIVAQKVIGPTKLAALQVEIAEILSMLEMVFPCSLFDMMVHLLGHIVDEIMILGPVYLHQMYPFERYIGILKGYVRNRAHPKACMIQGYHTEEIIDACINYKAGIESIGVPVS